MHDHVALEPRPREQANSPFEFEMTSRICPDTVVPNAKSRGGEAASSVETVPLKGKCTCRPEASRVTKYPWMLAIKRARLGGQQAHPYQGRRRRGESSDRKSV